MSEAVREPAAVPEISVVVANYNASAALVDCLEAIRRHPPARTCEVLVVDDGSTDDSAERVRTRFPEVRLLVNPVNQGYARSCNRAITAARGRLIHLLNNDTRLLPGALDALADFLDSRPSAGAAGSLLQNPDGSVQISAKALPSVRSAFFGGRSWISRWLPGNPFTRQELLHWRADAGQPFVAGYVSGASLLVPRDVLDRIGELDPHLFYFNDADFCRRIWDVGREVYCVPAARTLHLNHRGGSMRNFRQRLRSLVWFHLGAHRYFRKHSGLAFWHPGQALVAGALAARFALSLGLQLFREAVGFDRRQYGVS